MRDSNYRSITANRAAVTISTTLYDRRALDCTSDKPLVNSLNHLSFLASSSGKVRETLSNDGGIERLVDILYECKLDENNRNLDENPLVAWKWSLAFQCLVLVGTRGTELIRKKVVDAGMIPVIATVLDNYLAVHGNNDVNSNFARQYSFGAHNYQETNDLSMFQSPTQHQQQDDDSDINDAPDSSIVNRSAMRPSSTNTESITTSTPPPTQSQSTSSANVGGPIVPADDILKGISQCKKKTEQFHFWPDHIEQLKEKIDLMNNIVHLSHEEEFQDEDEFQSNKLLIEYIEDKNFSLDANKGKYAKYKKNRRQLVDLTAPRNFINGILVPREDDVLWSLQLLAFISKYSYLKPVLSETNIINGMSLRSPPQEDLLSFNGNFSNSVPALENDDNDNDNELEEIRSVENDKKDDCDEIMIDTDSTNNNTNQHNTVAEAVNTGEPILGDKLEFMLPLDMELNVLKLNPMTYNSVSVVCAELSNFDKLNMAVLNLESNEDRLVRAKEFVKLTKVLNKDLKHESLKFKSLKIKNNKLESQFIKSKWNYSTYLYFGNLNEDQDLKIKPSRMLNIFPLVEKFTVKSSHSKEIHYWAGVIMRNSCRRDESRGGVRQCACFECSKWEDYPRQFAKCRRCKRTKYCSKECQASLWEYHRHWCVQTSSSSSTAPTVPSTSAATMTLTGLTNAMNDITQVPQQQDDNDSINSSLNTTTTAALLRQQQQLQQPLITNPLGAFISPAQLSLNPDQQNLSRLVTPVGTGNNNNNLTPVLGPTNNNRQHNFGTILFHNAVHATLAATGSTEGFQNNVNNNNNGRGRFFFGEFGNTVGNRNGMGNNNNNSNEEGDNISNNNNNNNNNGEL